MTEQSRFQESSSFQMEASDGEVVKVDVFSEFVDATSRWSTTRPEWRQSHQVRYLGPGGRQVVPIGDNGLQFSFADETDRVFTRCPPYQVHT